MRITKIICFLLVLVIAIGCFPLATLAAGVVNPMDTTYVVDDLKAYFDSTDDPNDGIHQYPKDSDADFVSVINFLEYGYDYHGQQNYYGLYLYLYNPSGIAITEGLNYLQLSYVDSSEKATKYLKYRLTNVSVSIDSNDSNLFYKFKVESAGEIARNIYALKRTYNLSGIEIVHDGSSKAQDYSLEQTWMYQGYQANFGASDGAKENLYCTMEKLEVIPVEIHDASWFSNTSDLGIDYRYELSSVYFNIPNYFIEKYGNVNDETSGLYSVSGIYDKYVTNGLIVKDQTSFDLFDQYIDTDISLLASYDKSTTGVGGGFFQLDRSDSLSANHVNYEISYNMKTWDSFLTSCTSDNELTYICNLIKDVDGSVSGSTFKEVYYSLGSNHFENYKYLSNNNSHVFGILGSDISYEISVDQGSWNTAIKSFASNYDNNNVFAWLVKAFNGELFTDADGYLTIDPIVEITKDTNISGDELFVANEYVSSIKDFYDDYNSNNHIYLMRFDVNPYYCPEVIVTDDLNDPEYGAFEDTKGCYFEKAIFENFDILEFTFKDVQSDFTTVPVVCDPVDILGMVVPGSNLNDRNPNDGKLDEDPPGCEEFEATTPIKILLVVGTLVVISFVLSLFGLNFKDIFRAIGAIIMFPFNLIAKILDKLKKAKQKKRYKSSDSGGDGKKSKGKSKKDGSV